ncbi:MAG TPA: hypothetical protein VNV86_08920 [Candidatus Acidoferrum sp.]|nr:hypothetical protein [Candidatus Acidoferrum sp.]
MTKRNSEPSVHMVLHLAGVAMWEIGEVGRCALALRGERQALEKVDGRGGIGAIGKS